MANEKRRYQHTTYGNVAYDLNYQRNVVLGSIPGLVSGSAAG